MAFFAALPEIFAAGAAETAGAAGLAEGAAAVGAGEAAMDGAALSEGGASKLQNFAVGMNSNNNSNSKPKSVTISDVTAPVTPSHNVGENLG
jgi:hypothetical protein